MKLAKLAEQRMLEMGNARKAIVERWTPYISAVDGYLQKNEGRSLSDYDKQNVAQVLENAFMDGMLKNKSKLFETTYQDNISFLGIQLPVIAALLPSLVLNQISIVQALDRRQGAVFYLDIKTGQAKGAIASGSTLVGSKSGHLQSEASRRFSMDEAYQEAVGAAGSTSYSGNLAYVPVIAGTVVITDGVETFTDNGAGVLVTDVSGGTNGTINYTNGAYSVTFDATTPAAPTATYRFDYERATNGVASVDINLTNETLTARDFTLRSNYTLGAAIDLEKAHGLILEDEVVKYLGGEIKFELDHYGISLIEQAATGPDAATTPGNWNSQFTSGQEWLWHKYNFLDFVEKASNNILSKTLRGHASYMIVGNNGARVIRQLAPHFIPSPGLDKTVQTGPYVLGKLDGRLVIHDPFISTNRIIFGFKGDSYLFAGFIYAPYIPLFATPTLVTADLKAQKGFLSSAGYKVVNPGLFTYGGITNLS